MAHSVHPKLIAVWFEIYWSEVRASPPYHTNRPFSIAFTWSQAVTGYGLTRAAASSSALPPFHVLKQTEKSQLDFIGPPPDWAWLRKLGSPGPRPTSAGAKSKTAVSGRARSATDAQCRSVALWQRLCRPLHRGGTTRHRRPPRRLASPARPRELALRRAGAGPGARV